MTLLKKVSYGFVLCAGLTYIGLKISWPDSSWYTIFLVMQMIGYVALVGFLLLFYKVFKMAFVKAYGLAIICSYIVYLFVLHAAQPAELSTFLVKSHTGKDFIPGLFSFLLSNIAILVYSYFEERSRKVAQ